MSSYDSVSLHMNSVQSYAKTGFKNYEALGLAVNHDANESEREEE